MIMVVAGERFLSDVLAGGADELAEYWPKPERGASVEEAASVVPESLGWLKVSDAQEKDFIRRGREMVERMSAGGEEEAMSRLGPAPAERQTSSVPTGSPDGRRGASRSVALVT